MIYKLTASQEHYLEAIYKLSSENVVRCKDLAASLNVKLPSVTRAIKSLKELGLIEHKSYGKVVLTELGRKIGKNLTLRAEILKSFLKEILSFDDKTTDEIVNRLEHTFNAKTSARLQVLTSFALSSDAWIKRLHFRLKENSVETNYQSEVSYGESKIHQ